MSAAQLKPVVEAKGGASWALLNWRIRGDRPPHSETDVTASALKPVIEAEGGAPVGLCSTGASGGTAPRIQRPT